MCLFNYDYKGKPQPTKNWVENGTEVAGEFEKLCKAKGLLFYSTMNETKAALPEHTIRSLKSVLYCYMEDYGCKYINNWPQFVLTVISKENCSIDLIPKNVKNSVSLSNLYSKPATGI